MKNLSLNNQNKIGSKGTALIFTILLIGVLSEIIVFASRWATNDLKASTNLEESILSYYTAESGLEFGLLNWRHNKDIEEPINATETTGVAKNYIMNPTDPNNYYYDLKIWFKVNQLGNWDSPNLVLSKDNSVEFSSTDKINVLPIKFIATNIQPGSSYGLEIKRFNKNWNEWQTDFISPAVGGGITLYNISVDMNYPKVRIRPWGMDIKYALKADTGGLFGGLTHNISSTGYVGKTKRLLLAKLDHSSGNIINIYDFVLYSGTSSILYTP